MIHYFRTARAMHTPSLPPVEPRTHSEANDAQFEALLMQTSPNDLRSMVRELRKMLAGAEFAARTNAETVAAIWRHRS